MLSACKYLIRRKWFCALVALVALGAGLVAWNHHHVASAQRLFEQDRYQEAHDHLVQCLGPRSPDTTLLAARIERFLGKFQDAERSLAEARRSAGTTTERVQLELILLRLHRGEIQLKETGLQSCLDQEHPESALILKTIAVAAMRAMRYPAALYYLDLWEKKAPQNATVHEWRGWVLDRVYNRDEAMLAYQKSVELDPERFTPRLRLAELLVETLQFQPATEHLERLRQQKPDDAEVLLARARYHEGRGESATARQLSDQVLAQNAQHPVANLLRANLELKDGRADAGETFAREGVAARPYDYQLNYTLLRCLTLQGKTEAAAAQALKLEALQRDQRRLKHLIVEELERPGVDKRAISHEIGETFFRLDETERGLEWFYRTLELDPDYQPTHQYLIEHFEKHGQAEKAEQHRKRRKT